jgi:hypothetical protein
MANLVTYDASSLELSINGVRMPRPGENTPDPVRPSVFTAKATFTCSNQTGRVLSHLIEDLDFEAAKWCAARGGRKARQFLRGSHKRWSYEGRKLARRDYTPLPKGGV